MFKPAFENLSAFISMGGHGPYVWLAWFFGVLIIFYLILQSLHERRKLKRRVELNRLASANQKQPSETSATDSKH